MLDDGIAVDDVKRCRHMAMACVGAVNVDLWLSLLEHLLSYLATAIKDRLLTG